jgi:thioredoxin reductase (NADPH)
MDQETYDVIILGTGPAGLQAAIHAARAKVSVLVMGREHKSSLYKAHVENYLCVTEISGEEILHQGAIQAENAGASFLIEDVIETSKQDDWYVIRTESGRSLKTRAIIMAMGITRNRLGVPGEKELIGKGVSYCVDCDANFYKDSAVAVVGNESAAVAGALTLLFYATEVHLIAEQLQVTERMKHQILSSEVNVHEGRKIKKIVGVDSVEGVIMDNEQQLNVEGVFIEKGAKGAIELAAMLGVAMDNENLRYIVTDKQQKTNVSGIFAAGDICGPPWQVAKAVGEGCIAGLSAAKHAKTFRKA